MEFNLNFIISQNELIKFQKFVKFEGKVSE